MTNFIWDCRTIDCYPTMGELADVVYNVHWRFTGTREVDGKTYTATNIGTQIVPTEGIENFIPENELTNEIVTSWVVAAMGAERVAELETSIDAQIDDQINPKSITLTIGQNNG
jgi:hypothetical protein